MKKSLILITALCLSLSLAACGTSQAEVTEVSTAPTVLEPGSMEGIDPSITEKDGVHIPTIQELYDSREPEQSMAIAPGSMIPQGCAYFIYAENPEDMVRLVPGDLFPETSKNGDVLMTPYFKYTYYSELKLKKNPAIIDANNPQVHEPEYKRTGWEISSHFNDKERASYYYDVIGEDIDFEDALKEGLFPKDMYFKSCDEQLFGKINGWDVLSAKGLYMGNVMLEYAVDFPNEILDISEAFVGCLRLKESPKLPESAENMNVTFNLCEALEKGPEIPKSVFTMDATFYGCKNLKVPPILPNDGALVIMMDTFSQCVNLETFPEIPSTMVSMDRSFENCEKAAGDLIFHCNEEALRMNKSYAFAFDGCNLENIILTGDCPFIAEIHRELPEMQKGY